MRTVPQISQPQLVLHDNLPEEGVVLDTDLPEPFGSAMIWKLETNRALKLLKLEERKICELKYINVILLLVNVFVITSPGRILM